MQRTNAHFDVNPSADSLRPFYLRVQIPAALEFLARKAVAVLKRRNARIVSEGGAG